MHLVLEYSLVGDYLERRAALREEHLALAPADPYVRHGRVSGWTIREWAVVVGG